MASQDYASSVHGMLTVNLYYASAPKGPEALCFRIFRLRDNFSFT